MVRSILAVMGATMLSSDAFMFRKMMAGLPADAPCSTAAKEVADKCDMTNLICDPKMAGESPPDGTDGKCRETKTDEPAQGEVICEVAKAQETCQDPKACKVTAPYKALSCKAKEVTQEAAATLEDGAICGDGVEGKCPDTHDCKKADDKAETKPTCIAKPATPTPAATEKGSCGSDKAKKDA